MGGASGPRSRAPFGSSGGRKNQLHVLAYRGVRDARAFERQMEHLASAHPVVSPTRVLDTAEGGYALPPRAVLLAFHGLEGFVEHVLPGLRRHAFAAVLFLPAARAGAAELDSATLAVLARAGIVLGLGVEAAGAASAAEWSARLRRALLVLERRLPGQARVLAYPPGEPDPELVRAARDSGVELGLQSAPGNNDLYRVDRMRLRSDAVECALALEAFAARARGQANPDERGARSHPEGAECERRDERESRARRVRLRLVHRPLDAVLTARLGEARLLGGLRGLARWRGSHYERLRSLVQVVTAPVPGLGRALQRKLLAPERLPLAARGIELLGYGSAATVFGLEVRAGAPPHVLKVYRWTLGCPLSLLMQFARRHRARYQLLRRWLGAHVLPTHFLVLHGPLRGLPVAACLQERVARASDLLARSDAELLQLFRARPGLAAEFVGFARKVLDMRAAGFFPDLLGPGNLLLIEGSGVGGNAVGENAEGSAGPSLRLIDYGLYDLRTGTAHLPEAELEAARRRFEGLLRALVP